MGDNPTALLTLAQKLDRLFKTVLSPDGDEYTYREVTDAINQQGEARLSPAVLWRLRTGERTDPKMSQLEALARFFQVPLEYFFDGQTGEEIYRELELVAAMRDAEVRGIALRLPHLSPQSLQNIKNMIEHLRTLEGLPGDVSLPPRRKGKGTGGQDEPEAST